MRKQPTYSLGNEAVGLFYVTLPFFRDLYDNGEDKERKKLNCKLLSLKASKDLIIESKPIPQGWISMGDLILYL